MVFVICLIVALVMLIKEAAEPKLPPGSHRNIALEQADANKVMFGEMSKREFERNMKNGKYR